MIHEFEKPVLVETPLGQGYVWYVTDGKMFENDCFTVILMESGIVKHFTSEQIKVSKNYTYGIGINDKDR
jgi:hypothetical protein